MRSTAAEAAEDQRVMEALVDAVQRGAAAEAAQLLADDVLLVSDGGGRVPAVTRPVAGPRAVVRLLMGLAQQLRGRASHRQAAGWAPYETDVSIQKECPNASGSC